MKSPVAPRRSVIAFLVAGVALAASVTGFAQDTAAPAAKTKSEKRREVVWNNPDGERRPGITHHVLRSTAMEREVGYNVYLPPGYEGNSLRYPVIYFLHGAGGNENSDGPGFSRILAKLAEAKQVVPAICVFPNGGLSSYRDIAEGKIMVESMIIRELIPHIDRSYRTRPARESRMIAGYSMGSGGGMRLALKHPELFSAAGGWGASFTGRNPEAPLAPEFHPEALKRSPLRVRLFMIIGHDDPGLRGYGPALAALTEAKYPFTYRTLEGVAHNLGRYHELTGEDMVRFLLEGVAPASEM